MSEPLSVTFTPVYDRELQAMAIVEQLIEGLDYDAKLRVLEWALNRVKPEAEASKPQPEHRNVRSPP